MENGFYWVIYDLPGNWEPAEYDNGYWYFCGSEIPVKTVDKIGSKLIEPPSIA